MIEWQTDDRMLNGNAPRTLLEAEIGVNRYSAFYADPVNFIRWADREPWEYQAAYLRQALAKSVHVVDGQRGLTFDHRVVVISTPRQDGKSTLSAWVGLWRLFVDPTLEGDIVSVALDREGAQIILHDARRIIRGNELLRDLIDPDYGLTKSEIRLKDGRRWLIKSAEAVYSRGLRVGTLLFDELGWSQDDGDLLHTLSAAMAAQANPLTLITSTVGPGQFGPLWELFEQAETDEDILLIYSQENQSPKVTHKFLEGQRKKLPPAWFNREHLNLWGSGTDAFCSAEDYAQAARRPSPRRDHSESPTAAFLDLGWKKDETALAIGRKNESGVEIIWLEGFRPPRGGTLDLRAVEGRLRELVVRYTIRELEIESPQGVLLSQRLDIPGCRVEVLHPTAKSNAERWGALYTALQNGAVHLPGDKLLRRQLLSLTIQSGATGWRVEDQPSIHNDRAVAVAGAIYLLTRGHYVSLPDPKALKRASTWREPGASHPSQAQVIPTDGKSRWKDFSHTDENWTRRY